MYNNNIKTKLPNTILQTDTQWFTIKHQNLIVIQFTSSFIWQRERSQWIFRFAFASKSDFHRTHAFLFWSELAVSCQVGTQQRRRVSLCTKTEPVRIQSVYVLVAFRQYMLIALFLHQPNPSPFGQSPSIRDHNTTLHTKNPQQRAHCVPHLSCVVRRTANNCTRANICSRARWTQTHGYKLLKQRESEQIPPVAFAFGLGGCRFEGAFRQY